MGIPVSRDPVLCQLRPIPREVRDRGCSQNSHGEPAIESQGADGHSEGWQADSRDQQSVDRATDGSHDQGDQGRGRDGQAGLMKRPEHDAAQPYHARHRQIDLTGDDHQCHRQRDQQDRCDVEE